MDKSRKVLLLNNVSEKGTSLFTEKYEYGDSIINPDGVLVRSKEMKGMALPESLKAIARAGAGTNNIPIDECSEKGIVVFNTPGANANGVKELVIAGLLLASRDVIGGILWAQNLIGKGAEVPDLIEKGKAKFGGTEILGKKIGIIGLGAIGVLVAKAADAMGMNVLGYDPYLTQEIKKSLPRSVDVATDLSLLLSESDFISIHVPLGSETKGFINTNEFRLMKRGVKILNFARRELVNFNGLKWAIEEGIVTCYITDFPNEELLMLPQVINIPHLGASTEESEENCAIMATLQLMDYLENGNIKNSVNFPECTLNRSGSQRLTISNRNEPGMIERITHFFSVNGINVADMLNKSKGSIAYNIIDVDGVIYDPIIKQIEGIEGVIKVRVL